MHVSDLVGPLMPRHPQPLIIADIELLSVVLSSAIWGKAGIAHMGVSDNTNTISWVNRGIGSMRLRPVSWQLPLVGLSVAG